MTYSDKQLGLVILLLLFHIVIIMTIFCMYPAYSMIAIAIIIHSIAKS